MRVPIAGENANLEFARRLYASCLKLHGKDHKETRLLRQYIADLEGRDYQTHGVPELEATFVPLPPDIA
jgi:hypothetical protein